MAQEEETTTTELCCCHCASPRLTCTLPFVVAFLAPSKPLTRLETTEPQIYLVAKREKRQTKWLWALSKMHKSMIPKKRDTPCDATPIDLQFLPWHVRVSNGLGKSPLVPRQDTGKEIAVSAFQGRKRQLVRGIVVVNSGAEQNEKKWMAKPNESMRSNSQRIKPFFSKERPQQDK